MKIKLLTVLAASTMACSAQAASPFMVKHTESEISSPVSAPAAPAKSVTLAESLMQMRQCEQAGHVGRQDDETTQSSPATTTNTTPSVDN